MTARDVLGPAVAGSWYPADRHALASTVDRLLGGAEEESGVAAGGAEAAIAPHAGFTYSGAVAARALRTVAGSGVRRVVLVGPSHYFGFDGAAVPARAHALRTPLGDVPIDGDATAALAASPGFLADDRVFEPEHSLESEVPFLQRLCGERISIVPVLLGGGATREDASLVAAAVEPLLDDATRLVVSSDFTHYGPRFGYVPFEEDVPRRLRELDLGAVRAIESGQAAAFARYVDATGATICGRRAIDVLLRLRWGTAGGTLLAYDTSGRMTGGWDHSVSYAAIAFPRQEAAS
jgi:AmmeMemoRadiSam system protein B